MVDEGKAGDRTIRREAYGVRGLGFNERLLHIPDEASVAALGRPRQAVAGTRFERNVLPQDGAALRLAAGESDAEATAPEGDSHSGRRIGAPGEAGNQRGTPEIRIRDLCDLDR